MQQDRGFRPRFAPVKVGDELDVKIEAVGEKGDGIAKKEGFVLFVPNTKEGQEVKIRVTKVLRKVGFAEVVGEGAPQQEQPAEEAQAEQPQTEQEPAAQEEEQKVEDTEDFGEEEKK
jgi:predicted RNA-binding protein with TRAM domain